MANGFISTEATGIYEGTLLEDMIKTVAREHRLVCDVDIPDIFNKDFKHPYVYVPLWAMSLPLREGDKVQVIFNQGDFLYPVLYKSPDELPESFYTNFELPTGVQGGNIQMPKTSDNVSAQYLGEDSYLIKTEDYTLLHQNDGFVLITTDNKVFVYGDEINLSANGKLNIDCAQELTIKSNSTVTINNHFKVLA